MKPEGAVSQFMLFIYLFFKNIFPNFKLSLIFSHIHGCVYVYVNIHIYIVV